MGTLAPVPIEPAAVLDDPSAGGNAWLSRRSEVVVVVWASLAAFAAYFSMYAFRKPFTAGTFAGIHFLNTKVDLKTSLLLGQLIGYALSKYIGVIVCSRVGRSGQFPLLVGLIAIAETALLIFAVVPGPWKVLALFVNGLPLGMIWGLVVRYLEGRRASDVMLAVLSTSYILASGAVKQVGLYLMANHGIDEYWMPFVVGIVALPVFLVSVWMLTLVPPPNRADVNSRGQRESMGPKEWRGFLRDTGIGLLPLLIVYSLLTAYRDFRDNFGVEIVKGINFGWTETFVACGVLGALMSIYLLPTGRAALAGLFGLMTCGVALIGGATLLYQQGLMGAFTWYVAVGLGSYLAYVPFGAVLFERLIAFTRSIGTAVFAIQLADAAGYTASAGVMMWKDLAQPQIDRRAFFISLSYLMAILGVVLFVASAAFFLTRKPVASKAVG